MKCIVLGAAGFLGKECVEELLKRGDHVIAVDHVSCKKMSNSSSSFTGTLHHVQGDILNPEFLKEIFTDAEEVYNFAGKLGTSELESSLRSAIEVNVLGALQVFESALACKVPKVF